MLGSSVFAADYKGFEVIDGELIVKFRDAQALKSIKSLKSVDGIEELNVAFADLAVVKFKTDLETMMANLAHMPEVSYAEPNYVIRVSDFEKSLMDQIAEYDLKSDPRSPRDPQFDKLWGLINTGSNEPNRSGNMSGRRGVAGADIAALDAWELTKGSKDIVIAVIDTGIDYNHPDLIDNMWVNEAELNGTPGEDSDGNGYVDDVYGYNFAVGNGNPWDGHSHGTHCAGTIGAVHNNGLGVAGVMANVKLMAIKFLTDSGSGSTANAIKSIDYATKMNVDIMSNSWGGGGYSQALKESIERARDAGILFVAAAGNSGTNNDTRPHYPSNYEVENVISVASHNVTDSLSSFTCFGKATVHVAAPGENILSTIKEGKYGVYSGTSMATPHVSGILGLLLSKEGRQDVSEVRERLMKTSVYKDSYKNKLISEARANAYNLLMNIEGDRPSQPNPNNWVTSRMRDVFETPHPYENNSKLSYTITQPNAKYMRAVIEKIDVEAGYDFVIIKNGNGMIVEKITGAHENYISSFVEGDTLTIEFESDRSVARWGVRAKEFQYQLANGETVISSL
jgi:subtilisin family serine protease